MIYVCMYVCMYMYVSVYLCIYLCCMVFIYSKGKDQPGKVANPARGQLDRENDFFACPRSRLRIWSRETGLVAPSRVSLLISILKLILVLTYGILPEFRGGVHLFIKNLNTPSAQS